MNRQRLQAKLVQHEGLRLRVYQDTAGHPTIGVGRNLDVGIRESEAYVLLDNDIDSAVSGLRGVISNFDKLDDVRQEALINMVFNEGLVKFTRSNPRMIAAIEAGDFPLAAKEILDGPWKDQVKGRAYEIAAAISKGDWE